MGAINSIAFTHDGDQIMGYYIDNLKLTAATDPFPLVAGSIPDESCNILSESQITINFNTAMDTTTMNPDNITLQKVGQSGNIGYSLYQSTGTSYIMTLS